MKRTNKTKASVAPRKPKELVRLLLDDAKLIQAFMTLVGAADRRIENEMLSALRRWLRDNDVDLDLLTHDQVGEAMRIFYRKARLAGRYVRLW